jgi:hypothetical protein
MSAALRKFEKGLPLREDAPIRRTADILPFPTPAWFTPTKRVVLTPSAAITPVISVSRSSGGSPVSVIFDASGSSGTGITAGREAFKKFDAEWDFGDPDGDSLGNTALEYGIRTGAGSRNKAYTIIAEHTYDLAWGASNVTRTTTLTLRTATEYAVATADTSVTAPQNIFTTVIAVGASTLPVAGVDGVPAGATCTTNSNMGTVIAANKGANVAILGKHDDTFTLSGVNYATTGPMMLGMYGTGAKPKMTRSGTGDMCSPTGTCSDVRIVDWEFDGQSQWGVRAICPSALSTCSNTLLLRCEAHHMASALELHQDQTTTNIPTGFTINHCNFHDMGSNSGSVTPVMVRYAGEKFAMNNSRAWDNTNNSGEHAVRCQLLKYSVITNCDLGRSGDQGVGNGKELLAIRCLQWGETKWGLTNDDLQSQFTVVAENFCENLQGAGLQISYDSGGELDNRWHDIIFEKNEVYHSGNNGCPIWLYGQYHTIRNNLLYAIGFTIEQGVRLEPAGSGHPTACINCDVYNNTIYSSVAGNTWGIKVAVTTGNNVKNNIVYFPNGGSAVISGTPASSGGNSATVTTNPSFSTSPPTERSHFALGSGSSFRDFGVDVDVMRDLINAWRDQSGVDDSGALAFTTGTPPSDSGGVFFPFLRAL